MAQDTTMAQERATAGQRSPVGQVLDAEDLRARVQKSLDAFLSERASVVADVATDALPLVDYVTDLLGGGKRLRPAFCYWGWRGAGGADCAEIVEAATSLELFQAAALVHDDVMDDSDTRRGMPAVHRRFAVLHRDAGWHGPAERFGTAGAVLAGDLCLAWSDELLTGSGLSVESLRRGRPVYDRMRTELMAGQYLDMLEQARAGGGPDPADRALRVVRYKSAKYTIEHPLLFGGALAGGDEALLAAYSACGLPLGEAFQLRDDLLGVFGDPAETGKPAGDDLREGKRTLLVALALERASAAQTETVRRLLGDPQLDADGVAVLRDVLVSTGAQQRVEEHIAENVRVAGEALSMADIDESTRDVLAGLIAAATSRAA